jgi:serine/threonine protein kinase
MSDDAYDLLLCILTKDPVVRYRIKHIKQHAWFSLHQPEYSNPGICVGYEKIPHNPVILDMLEDLSKTDQREEKLRIKFERDHIVRCLEANKHTYETTLYYLLENHMRELHLKKTHHQRSKPLEQPKAKQAEKTEEKSFPSCLLLHFLPARKASKLTSRNLTTQDVGSNQFNPVSLRRRPASISLSSQAAKPGRLWDSQPKV